MSNQQTCDYFDASSAGCALTVRRQSKGHSQTSSLIISPAQIYCEVNQCFVDPGYETIARIGDSHQPRNISGIN